MIRYVPLLSVILGASAFAGGGLIDGDMRSSQLPWPVEGCSHCTYFDGWHGFSNSELCQWPEENPGCKSCDGGPEAHPGCHDTQRGACTGHPGCNIGTLTQDLNAVLLGVSVDDAGAVAAIITRNGSDGRLVFNPERDAIQVVDCFGSNVIGHFQLGTDFAVAIEEILRTDPVRIVSRSMRTRPGDPTAP